MSLMQHSAASAAYWIQSEKLPARPMNADSKSLMNDGHVTHQMKAAGRRTLPHLNWVLPAPLLTKNCVWKQGTSCLGSFLCIQDLAGQSSSISKPR